MKRGLELQNLSTNIGLSYAERIDKLPDYIIDCDFLLFTSFHVDRKKVLPTCFKNILTGKLGRFEIFLSDFKSDYSVDNKAFGYKQTIAILRSSDFSFRRFCLIPKKAERFTVRIEHIGQDFGMPIIKGYKNIPFSISPQLNSKYTLKAQGIHDSQELFRMSFMQYLEDNSKWFIEGSSDALLIYRRGKRINPLGMREYIKEVVEIGNIIAV